MKANMLFMALGLAGCLWGGALDGEAVYKNNCNRCHITIRTYSEKMSRSIVRHMRVKAQLTKPEADAVVEYLVANSGHAAEWKNRRIRQ